MSLQEDIMNLLSSVSSGGDRARDRTSLGEKLLDNIGQMPRQALTEVEAARGAMGDMDMSRVADILEKYMTDSQGGVSDFQSAAQIPVDTQPLPPLPDVQSPYSSQIQESPEPAATVMEPAETAMELDATAMDSLMREMGGRQEMNQTRVRDAGLSSISGGAIPLRDRLMEGQGEPMSVAGQLALASTFIPAAALPAAARAIGMSARQISQYLRAGRRGEEALRQVVRQRTQAKMMRDPATGRMVSAKDVGPQPQSPLNRMMRQAQSGGVPTGAYAAGGSLRDRIMKTYGNI